MPLALVVNLLYYSYSTLLNVMQPKNAL